MHPHDPDAKITKMKDGRTHLAHKAEHAIDLETGAIVGVTVQDADKGDTTTIQATLPKRLLVHAGAFNLGLWMRTLLGVGTPRSLQGRVVALGAMIAALWAFIDDVIAAVWSQYRDHARSDRPSVGISRRRVSL